MIRRRIRLLGAMGVLALVTVACSGDDDSGSTTADSTVGSTVAETSTTSTGPTSTAATTTTEPTALPSTTTLETTVPATDPPPTTSTTLPDGVPPRVTFPDDPELQAVMDAFYEYFDALRAASEEPSNPAKVARLRAAVTAPIADRVDEFIATLLDGGEAIVGNPDQPTYTEVFETTAVAAEDSASFDACAIDADIRVRVGTAPDGSDEIVDDTLVSAALTYSLRLESGMWFVSDLNRLGVWEDQVGCGD